MIAAFSRRLWLGCALGFFSFAPGARGQVPEFSDMIPTTENIAIAIWRRLEGKIEHAKLYRVRVYEMADLFADFYGEGA